MLKLLYVLEMFESWQIFFIFETNNFLKKIIQTNFRLHYYTDGLEMTQIKLKSFFFKEKILNYA